MQKIYNTAIVGGGASGLMTAVELLSGDNALLGKDVVILERNDRVGKKLIATGNGQGNLTNDNFSSKYYRGETEFLSSFIENAASLDLKGYFNSIGIPLCAVSDGRVYPLSKQASAVLDILRAFLAHKNCQIETNTFITSIKKEKDYFVLKSESGVFKSKNVVLAVGGSAGKQFGTDGSSYSLATNFGHKKGEIYPSLVQLKTQKEQIRGLKGLKETALVSLYKNEKQVACFMGDLLFTDFGVSGNSIFQISAYLDGKGSEELNIEFLPQLSLSQLTEILQSRLNSGFIQKEDILCGIINKKIGQAILKQVKNFTAKNIALAVKNFRLKVLGNLGFDYAQVTKGGILTKDICKKTYQSKLQKGLYLVGEYLDIDGDCGGYNLTFAFVSGIIAGRSIKNA